MTDETESPMPDLHGWISQKVDAVEERARACPPSPLAIEEGASDYVPLEVRTAGGQAHPAGLLVTAAAVLRRCAADRMVLARHRHDPESATWSNSPYPCRGCGFEGDCDDPVTEHVNDCPELLDLANAHGITDDELAALDRPARPRREEAYTAISVRGLPPTPTSDVPAALRGPNWKPRPTA